MFDDALPQLNSAWAVWSQFIVLDTPENNRLFSKADGFLNEIKAWFAKFPTFSVFQESKGIKKGGGIGAHKFFAHANMLKTLKAIGLVFHKQSSDDTNQYEFRNLFITSLSYEHDGKMPPHKEHKTGKDADIWGRRIDQGKSDFDKKRTLNVIVALLKLNVSRVIYTHSSIVKEANKKVPANAVADPGSGHKDHIHFDVS